MKNVLVLGAGNIGSLIAYLFSREDDYNVTLCDKNISNDVKSLFNFSGEYYNSGVDNQFIETADNINLLDNFDILKPEALYFITKMLDTHIIVSALPYELNIYVATIAANNGIHYFDLTEDVNVKNTILGLSKDATSILMSQCGLAPGFINIIGNSLMAEFDTIDSAKLRVGALPQQVSNAFNYALTWSTNGLINEYGNPCEAVIDGVFTNNIQPLEGMEKILIDGVEYEAFNTSGGLGTLAETWNSDVSNLNYKTLRYPGHCEKIKFLMNDMGMNKHRDELETMLTRSIPTTTQDVIVIYVSVSGMINNKFIEKTYVNKIYPKIIGDYEWTGIQITTAAGICAAVDMMVSDDVQGFCLQEDLIAEEFLVNRFGMHYNM